MSVSCTLDRIDKRNQIYLFEYFCCLGTIFSMDQTVSNFECDSEGLNKNFLLVLKQKSICHSNINDSSFSSETF